LIAEEEGFIALDAKQRIWAQIKVVEKLLNGYIAGLKKVLETKN
jgi:hypothetical protein